MSADILRAAADRLRELGTMSAADLAVSEVGCPTCNARAGSPCQAMDGPARCTHKARIRSGSVLRLAVGLLVPCEQVADLLDAVDRAARLAGVAADHPEAASIRQRALAVAEVIGRG